MILFTPALQILSQKIPDIKIDFLIFQKASVFPIKNHPNVNNVYFSDFSFKEMIKTVFDLKKIYYDYSLVTTGVRYWKSLSFQSLLNSKTKIVEYIDFHIPTKGNYINIKRDINTHFVLSNINLIKGIVGNTITNIPSPKYFFKENLNLKKENVIGIHTGTNLNFKEKRWNPEYYKEVINWIINNTDINVKIFVGPEEKEEGAFLKKFFYKNKRVLFIEDKSLDEVSEEIGKCKYFLNNDSGLGHIASCFNCKIVVIKTKTSKANLNQTRPFSKVAKIIDMKKEGNEIEAVIRELKKIF